jgi:hypothetical protein
MMEEARPWIGMLFAAMMVANGIRCIRHPAAGVGIGVSPTTSPRVVRALGILSLILGLFCASLGLFAILSE